MERVTDRPTSPSGGSNEAGVAETPEVADQIQMLILIYNRDSEENLF